MGILSEKLKPVLDRLKPAKTGCLGKNSHNGDKEGRNQGDKACGNGTHGGGEKRLVQTATKQIRRVENFCAPSQVP
jgi:hypothetical protein